MTKRMLIDATHNEEIRVAVVDDKNYRLLEFDYESKFRKPLKGSIFLAKVTRVEPSLQAAFVNFGGNRHGFLPFSEIHPDYYRIPISDREALMAEQEAYLVAEEERRANREREEEQRKQDEEARKANGATIEEASDNDDDEDDYEDDEDDSIEELNTDGPDNMAPPAMDDGEPQNQNSQSFADESSAASYNRDDADDHETAEDLQAAIADDFYHKHADAGDSDDSDSVGNMVPDESDSDNEVNGNRVDAETHMETARPEGSDDAQGRRRFRHGRNRRGGRNGGGGGHSGGGRRHAAHRSQRVEILGGTEYEDDGNSGEQRFRMNLRRQYKIQEVIKRGQIMLIQVSREERGNKGAAVTTYLSMPGRYGVLMPNSPRSGGVSRKIANIQDRARMRDMLKELDVPKGMSVILRTAGVSRTEIEIKRDVEYLMRLWDDIRELTLKSSAPAMIYEEADLIKKAIRDLYTRDVEEILVSGHEGYKNAEKFVKMLIPSHTKKIVEYKDNKVPLFHRYHVESQIAEMGETTAKLKSGGYLVINPTEALVSIDVNSGRATKERHIEETALNTNLEAAEEVARQMRLRDLGGLIVIDFIDMEDRRNNARVERKLKEALSSDRARIQIGRISSFGLLELSRQRLNPSFTEAQFETCKHCAGRGVVRNCESTSIMLIRALEHEGIKGKAGEVIVYVASEVALYILNNKRAYLDDIEKRYGLVVVIRTDEKLGADGYRLEASKPAEVENHAAQDDRHSSSRHHHIDNERDDSQADDSETDEMDDNASSHAKDGDDFQQGQSQNGRRRGRRGGRNRNRNRNRDHHNTPQSDTANEESSDHTNNDQSESDHSPAEYQAEGAAVNSEAKEPQTRTRTPRGRGRAKAPRKDEETIDNSKESEVVHAAPQPMEPEAPSETVAKIEKPKATRQPRKPVASAAYETVTEAAPQERKKGWWNRLVE